MQDDIKIVCGHHSLTGWWWVRVNHDIPNGSAISAHADTLPQALEKLAARIRETSLQDKIWQEVCQKTEISLDSIFGDQG